MYTKLLVPLDGSAFSESILPYARSLAKTLKLPVELFQAIDPEIITALSDPGRGRYADVVAADLSRDSLQYLEIVAGSFPEPSSVDCRVEIGDAPSAIVERAETHTGTLIAMSTHGRSGLKRWLMGSVADKVLQATKNHLLLVRPADPLERTGLKTLKTILVPLDGSELAERVLPHVSDMAKKLNIEVVLVRVYAVWEALRPSEEYNIDMASLRDRLKAEAERYLGEKVAQLKAEGLDRVRSSLLEGDPAGQIIYLAQETPDNIVATCTHGRSGMSRWVLGSITEKVVRHSGDPVLVLRV